MQYTRTEHVQLVYVAILFGKEIERIERHLLVDGDGVPNERDRGRSGDRLRHLDLVRLKVKTAPFCSCGPGHPCESRVPLAVSWMR